VRRLVAALDRYVVTAFVDQAGYAATIYPDTANTLRVLTLCDADGCFVAAAAHRFGSRRSGSIDNWHRGHGGLNAPIDRARGALGRAVTLRDDGRLIETSGTGHRPGDRRRRDRVSSARSPDCWTRRAVACRGAADRLGHADDRRRVQHPRG
jgi:hypothetical protein